MVQRSTTETDEVDGFEYFLWSVLADYRAVRLGGRCSPATGRSVVEVWVARVCLGPATARGDPCLHRLYVKPYGDGDSADAGNLD